MVWATYDTAIDWNNDGDWSDSNETVTSRVIEEATTTLGRDQSRAFAPIAPGTMTFVLNNTSRDYSPENSSSPIGSNLKPGRAVRQQATFSSTTYGLWRGFTEDFNVLPARGLPKVQVSCSDALARLRNTTISTPLYEGIRTGDAIGYILDAAGWSGSLRALDGGSTVIPYFWVEQTDAFTALQQVVASEGSPAIIFVDPSNGNFVFWDRSHRLRRSTSTTSQVTFRDTGTEPLWSAPIEYQAGWSDVINDVTIQVDERRAERVGSVVWSLDERVSIGSLATVTIEVQTDDPFKVAAAPTLGTDFNILSGGILSLSLSRTSGQSTTITILGDSGGAVLDSMQLRAYSVPVVRSIKVRASDSTSIIDYGSRGLPDELVPVWAGRFDAKAIADLYVMQRKQRLPTVSITVKGAANSTRLTQCLSRQLSDRITVVDAQTGLNADFFIERIQHQMYPSQGGRVHVTTFGLEKAPASPSSAGFVLNTSVLNTGTLGY